MAAAIVGGALISAAVEALLDKIISPDFVDFFRSKKLNVSLLDKLKITLLSLQAILNDVEEKQITNDAVKEWLDMLTDAVFDADDLLDEINTQALRRKVKRRYQIQSVGAKVRNVLSSRFKESEINSKMQALFERLEHFGKKADLPGLKVAPSNVCRGTATSSVVDESTRVWRGTPTGSVVDESTICGRDHDKNKLKGYLLPDASGSDNKVGVIAIVGMGGLGKTTLAKLLYNDPEVREKFDLRAWACISEDFDVCRVTKTLLESISSEAIVTPNLNTLQVKLHESLSHKRFLVVLDDIWEASYVDWADLKNIFNAGEMGSKIIITTRDESVANAMQAKICHLSPLDGDDSWSLIAKHAFGENNCSERSNLEGIGKEIAKKCHGLPLAAVALGGLLCTNLSESYWKKILKSNIWDLPKVNIQPALLLSYHYLPAPLKRCFAYCSVFPKDFELEKKMVVQLWIAEGLVDQSKSEKTMEEVGDDYFDELVSRSLISRQHVDGEANFEMHDLINDLASMVSSAYCIRYEEGKPHQSLEKIRHLSYNMGNYDHSSKFDAITKLKCLRTFLALPQQWYPRYYLSNKVVHDLLPAMKQLRVLSLSHYRNVTMLPDSIRNLIHLRYLNLSFTSIERLPSVTCKLVNLQTLLLSNCRRLIELPEDMGNLVNLRHLDISGTQLKEMPAQIAGLEHLQTLLLSNCQCPIELPKEMGNLVNLRHLDISGTKLKEMPTQLTRIENLQPLSDFVVGKSQEGLKVGELGKFPHMQGKLSISNLQNVVDPSDASEANLKMEGQIDKLALEWDYNTASEGSELESLVLERLEPSTNLKELIIKFYGGTSFPNWLGVSSFDKMVCLNIFGCHHCSTLPPLGQLPSLEKLCISSMKSVNTVGAEFYGSSSSPSFQPFPSLQILSFSQMPEWEEWNLIGGTATEFPTLRKLHLTNCPKLKGNIPSNLPSFTTLELMRCPLLGSGHSEEVDNTNSNIISPSNVFTQWVLSLNSLRELTISGFPSLTSFPRDGLPKTLRRLYLSDCENLEFLPHESLCSYTSLEDLTIRNSCCSLRSFSLGSLPVLKFLVFEGCKSLKSISIAKEEDSSQSLSFLRWFKIRRCHELESFPHDGFCTPNLSWFLVDDCDKLNSLPEPIHTLTGLDDLTIDKLPSLQSFATEGLPINLKSLSVSRCEKIYSDTAISKWGLEKLTRLSRLVIQGDALLNALINMEAPLLLTSLVSLEISDADIKCLDGKWLQCLNSLKELTIQNCKRLESLPKKGLPSSLLELTIRRCPLLEASCQRKRGKEWRKIAHIPRIIIGDQLI